MNRKKYFILLFNVKSFYDNSSEEYKTEEIIAFEGKTERGVLILSELIKDKKQTLSVSV